MDKITKEKLEKYFQITKAALEEAEKNISSKEEAKEVLDMASRYYKDAHFFEQKGDLVTAFAAINYAHGWLDAGARLKLFNVKDNSLFVVDGE